jgi:hypothetical protein
LNILKSSTSNSSEEAEIVPAVLQFQRKGKRVCSCTRQIPNIGNEWEVNIVIVNENAFSQLLGENLDLWFSEDGSPVDISSVFQQ